MPFHADSLKFDVSNRCLLLSSYNTDHPDAPLPCRRYSEQSPHEISRVQQLLFFLPNTAADNNIGSTRKLDVECIAEALRGYYGPPGCLLDSVAISNDPSHDPSVDALVAEAFRLLNSYSAHFLLEEILGVEDTELWVAMCANGTLDIPAADFSRFSEKFLQSLCTPQSLCCSSSLGKRLHKRLWQFTK